MPPLRAEINLNGTVRPLQDVAAGEVATFTDYTPNPSLLAIRCNPEDDGGVVYRITDPEYVELPALGVRLIEPDVGQIEAIIEPGGAAELTFRTRKFGDATMKLQQY